LTISYQGVGQATIMRRHVSDKKRFVPEIGTPAAFSAAKVRKTGAL
jgi:hypothetical protein